MATVLHRATLELRRSVDEARLPREEWLINPDLKQVSGVDRRYWKLEGGSVVAMGADERAAKDASDAASERALKAALIEEEYNSDVKVRSLALLLLDEVNDIRAQFSLPARTPDEWRAMGRAKLGGLI